MFWPMFFVGLLVFAWLFFNHGVALMTTVFAAMFVVTALIAIVTWGDALVGFVRRRREAHHPR